MKYKVIRTETADAHIRKIILYVTENFGSEVALNKLEELEQGILEIGNHPSRPIFRCYGYRGVEGNIFCSDSSNVCQDPVGKFHSRHT